MLIDHFNGFLTVDRKIGLQANATQQLQRYFLIDRIIFSQQDARLAITAGQQLLRFVGRDGRSAFHGLVAGPLQARREPEGTALSLCALQAAIATHQQGQSAGDGEAEAGAAKTPCR